MSEKTEQGGDPACWSHLFDDERAMVTTADLTQLSASATTTGPIWTMQSADLNANLIRLGEGDGGGEIADGCLSARVGEEPFGRIRRGGRHQHGSVAAAQPGGDLIAGRLRQAVDAIEHDHAGAAAQRLIEVA